MFDLLKYKNFTVNQGNTEFSLWRKHDYIFLSLKISLASAKNIEDLIFYCYQCSKHITSHDRLKI